MKYMDLFRVSTLALAITLAGCNGSSSVEDEETVSNTEVDTEVDTRNYSDLDTISEALSYFPTVIITTDFTNEMAMLAEGIEDQADGTFSGELVEVYDSYDTNEQYFEYDGSVFSGYVEVVDGIQLWDSPDVEGNTYTETNRYNATLSIESDLINDGSTYTFTDLGIEGDYTFEYEDEDPRYDDSYFTLEISSSGFSNVSFELARDEDDEPVVTDYAGKEITYDFDSYLSASELNNLYARVIAEKLTLTFNDESMSETDTYESGTIQITNNTVTWIIEVISSTGADITSPDGEVTYCSWDEIEDLSCGNTAPTAADYTADALGTDAVIVDLADSISDAESDDSDLTITVVTSPANGTLSWSGTEFTYTLTGMGISDSFTYKVTDPYGGESSEATVTLVDLASLLTQ